MLTFTIRRLLISIPTLLFISLIIFLLLNLAPNDPMAQVPLTVPPEVKEKMREALGLGQPLYVQFWKWLVQFFWIEPQVLIDYYFKHSAIVVMPLIMARSFGFRFPKWGWMWTYVSVAVLTTVVGLFNWWLNTYFPSEITANYMYMWEAPKADNPFVVDLPRPWYILPLHGALIVHLLLINALYRWGTPVAEYSKLSWMRRHFS